MRSDATDGIKYEFEGFKLDVGRRTLRNAGGDLVIITARAFDALVYLVEHAGELVERKTLTQYLWPRTSADDNNLNALISTLRHLLNDTSHTTPIIATVSGRGYQFVAQVHSAPAESDVADSGTAPPIPTAAAPAKPADGIGMPIVAVLPITHRGEDDELDFLAEDLTEEITREMARSRYFDVIAAGTMTAWRGNTVDYRAVGQAVAARYLFEGKLQRSGESIRLTVQLVDSTTSSVLWSVRMARTLAEVETSPEAFAATVASVVCEQIIQTEVSVALATPSPHSAWQHMMRYFAYSGGIFMRSESLRKAIEEARLAVEAAPHCCISHALLAAGLAEQVSTGSIDLNDNLRREIQAYATRAMQLNGANPHPIVLTTLAMAYGIIGQGENGLRLALRGVKLNPHSPRTLVPLAITYLKLGRIPEAIATLSNEGRPIDSVRHHELFYLGICYALDGRPVDAEDALGRSLALNPEGPLALKWKAIVAAQLGKEAIALDTIRQLRAVEPTLLIEQHVRQILQIKEIAERAVEPVAILRRLWGATESDA